MRKAPSTCSSRAAAGPQRSDRNLHPVPGNPQEYLCSLRMQKSRSQYESFLFWRQPIAELDLTQLEGLMDGPPANSIKGKDTLSSARSEEAGLRLDPEENLQLILSECKTCPQ
ncbi:protein AF1q isoform X2 [Pseudoliparis swirei]|uniref:protein AF1q isoform X2 n=1 Tax=Pseudoliparis swirei TaxID=2059687 RepID=UPI0024BE2CDC|nr:protein AF1q isoform X2 [Pseudoliparis swirei]